MLNTIQIKSLSQTKSPAMEDWKIITDNDGIIVIPGGLRNDYSLLAIKDFNFHIMNTLSNIRPSKN
jgi:hypothetical protein